MKLSVFLLTAWVLATPLQASDDEPRDIVEQNCYMCHSPDLVGQQRLTPPQWHKVVQKMQYWGAPIDAEDVDRLATYLARLYKPGKDAPAKVEVALVAVESSVFAAGEITPGDAGRGATLYAQSCASCHGPDAKGGAVCPALFRRPVISRPETWRDILTHGRRKMPGFGQFTAQQIFDVLAWVRSVSVVSH